ncbi:MAG: flavodoxin [Lachnospiraceae bacterium]|nr:flavodoxin [Lachnospiraceae bacterium]
MKKILSIMTLTLLLGALTACGGNSQAQTTSDTQAAETQIAAEAETAAEEAAEEAASETSAEEAEAVTEEAPAEHAEVLVAYFSATGTTKGVAERIAAVTGGDLYEILAAEPYSDADLNYNDSSSRSTKEQNDKSARPEIGSEDISLDGYTTVYLGFPIWWGEEPRILDTFVEKYSFEGITVIPFCTSGSSGIGRSGPNMEALAGSGTWLEGKRFGGNVSEADLQSWIEGLK